jgi:rhodanese-related sulfurtransferase
LELSPEVILALLLVGALMALPIVSRKLYGPVDYVLPRELMARLDAGERVRVLDIRPPGDFANGHILVALNVPRKELARHLAEPEAGNGPPPVLVCQSDLRSIAAARMLERGGHGKVVVMKGGMHRWKRDRLPVEPPLPGRRP